MRITGTGHAGMLIETAAGNILCDPWVNPAYFGSWFVFPDNSGLDWDRLGACDYLYVSHLHRDHFDAAQLRRYVSKKATVLLPEYPTHELEDELRALGFTSFLRTRGDEPVALGGGLTVMIQALVSPTDGPIGDSSLWVEHDGVRPLNQNDARPRDLSEFRRLGHVHAHLLQFSGAIWYPMVYELPSTAKKAFGKQKRERQLDRTLRYIDGLGADWVFPIAGPPCFLDEELWSNNDLGHDEGTIFPDQQVFLDEYRGRGRDNAVILLPGTAATVTPQGCEVVHPVPDVREFFAGKQEYLRAYQRRARAALDAERASWHEPGMDVLAELSRRLNPLLASSRHLADGVGGPVRLDLTDDEDRVTDRILVDFPDRRVREAGDEKVRYRFRTRRPLVERLLASGEVDWVNSLFLSCRFSASRIGQRRPACPRRPGGATRTDVGDTARRSSVTRVEPHPIQTRPWPVRRSTPGSALARLLRTTDAKQIGVMYLVTSFAFFLVGGVMALLMRAELARPGLQFLSPEQYNQLFTMHGTIMLLFFATPVVFAFANYIVPLQIGAPDVAFPRLNAFSYWLFLFGGSLTIAGFATPSGAADFGWFAYAPLSNAQNSPGAGANMWFVGVAISGLGTILGAVNMTTTIITLRAPGMTTFRMPIFTWNIFVTSLLVLMIFPFLAAAALALMADRVLGAHVYDPATGGPLLWQHLFWFFGHPEVYVIALPFFGIVSEVVPVFSRKPIFGYKGMIAATMGIAALSMSVWAHHMYATGQVLLPFFAFMTFLIAVPTGIKFFNWIGTMWRGQLSFETPMLFAIGFLLTFLVGGLSGVLLASPPLDFHVSDTYFVVAHFHYTLFGTIVFAVFAGVYYWFPKMTGRMLDERLGKVHFWLTTIGFHTTFLVQHWLGAEGMPRRYADYLPSDGFTTLNTVSSIGAFILGCSTLPFLYNVWKSYKTGPVVTVDDPWGYGMSLEWATSCPPPLRNFDRLPRIRSERPAWDLKFPDRATGGTREPVHVAAAPGTVPVTGGAATAAGGSGAAVTARRPGQPGGQDSAANGATA